MQGSSLPSTSGETQISSLKQPRSVIQKIQSLISFKVVVMLSVLLLTVVSLPLAFRSASQPTRTTSQADDGQVAGLGQNEYYIAPSGTPNAFCTLSQPCDRIETVISLPSIGTAPNDTIIFKDGVYRGLQKIVGKHFDHPVTIKAEHPYKAVLENNGNVIKIENAYNVRITDFEMRHVAPITECSTQTNSAYIIQISDGSNPGGPFGAKRGADNGYYDSESKFHPNGTDYTGAITIQNNIIHDSFCEDLIKLQNGGDITIAGNMFYNQATRNNVAGGTSNGGTPEEAIDINSVFNVRIVRNIFFNNFSTPAETGSFIVVKDSSLGVPHGAARTGLVGSGGQVVVPYPNNNTFIDNTNNAINPDREHTCDPAGTRCDTNTGSNNVTLEKNIFMNFSNTSKEMPWLQFGAEDTLMYVLNHGLVENNLFLGNSGSIARALFELEGVNYFTFRNNTITGNLPSKYFGYRLKTQGSSAQFPNSNVSIQNNVWSDPTGTMGAEDGPTNFARAESNTITVTSLSLTKNAFWNSGNPIPITPSYLAQHTTDPFAVLSNPLLPNPDSVRSPVWNGGSFLSAANGVPNYPTITEALDDIAARYGTPQPGSSLIDSAATASSPATDILERERGSNPDIGAVESNPYHPPSPSPTPTPTPPSVPNPSPNPGGFQTLRFNFQPENSTIPSGFIADYGNKYGPRNNTQYGWSANIKNAVRKRSSGESQLRDTLIHMQLEGTYRWEVQVPNGTYTVNVMAGDPNFTDQWNSLKIENVVLEDDTFDNFDYYTATVTVNDGRLTISPASSAKNAKLNYIIVSKQAQN